MLVIQDKMCEKKAAPKENNTQHLLRLAVCVSDD